MAREYILCLPAMGHEFRLGMQDNWVRPTSETPHREFSTKAAAERHIRTLVHMDPSIRAKVFARPTTFRSLAEVAKYDKMLEDRMEPEWQPGEAVA